MKTLTIIACAILSLFVGIACASPLLVSELNIEPWLKHVQGPTMDFEVNTVYANFTIENASKPIETDSGPTLSFEIVVNVTNPSDLNVTLMSLDFTAAQKITRSSNASSMNYQTFTETGTALGISGFTAEGAWVDGKWYNVTWTDGSYPFFDRDGNMVPPPFQMTYHWIEGVMVYDKYNLNGKLAATYMNMNGTWTNVTGRINVTRPPAGIVTYTEGYVLSEAHYFANVAVRNYSSNDIAIDLLSPETFSRTVNHLVGEGLFDNNWAPHESRLIMLSGSYDVRYSSGHPGMVGILQSTLDRLKSGNLTFETKIKNWIIDQAKFVNNTITQTWMEDTELKTVQLTQYGNSYVYNTVLNSGEVFVSDPWDTEVFIKSGS